MNGDNIGSGRQGREAVPDGILALHAASHEPVGFVKMKLGGKPGKFRLHTIAHHENDFGNTAGLVKPLPSVSHHRPAGDLEPEFIHAGSHAGALASGNDDGGRHVNQCKQPKPKAGDGLNP